MLLWPLQDKAELHSKFSSQYLAELEALRAQRSSPDKSRERLPSANGNGEASSEITGGNAQLSCMLNLLFEHLNRLGGTSRGPAAFPPAMATGRHKKDRKGMQSLVVHLFSEGNCRWEWRDSTIRQSHAVAGEDSALQQEVRRLREENAALAQRVKSYEADVANLISLGGIGHQGSWQKKQQQA